MIDQETERAVERWVRLGDQIAGRKTADDRGMCARCGSREHLLDRGEGAYCARCYLERGDPSSDDVNAAVTALTSASLLRPSPR